MTDQEDNKDNVDMTEQRYLELAQDFKNIMEEKEQEIKKIKAELNDLSIEDFENLSHIPIH